MRLITDQSPVVRITVGAGGYRSDSAVMVRLAVLQSVELGTRARSPYFDPLRFFTSRNESLASVVPSVLCASRSKYTRLTSIVPCVPEQCRLIAEVGDC